MFEQPCGEYRKAHRKHSHLWVRSHSWPGSGRRILRAGRGCQLCWHHAGLPDCLEPAPLTRIMLIRNELQIRFRPRTRTVVATKARCTVDSIGAPKVAIHFAVMAPSIPVPTSARATPVSRPASSEKRRLMRLTVRLLMPE